MPMTLAHPAAVLPLRRFGMPMAAMVIGSMVPDVPLFMRWSRGYQVSHSYTGLFTVNLIGALVLLYGWNAFVRDALVDLAPDVVRARLAARHRLSRRQWLLAPAAAVLGSLTHLAWDAFTHPGRWGVAARRRLRADLGPLPAFKWAQYASGVIGLASCSGRSSPTSVPGRPTNRCESASFPHRCCPSWSARPRRTASWRDWPGWARVSTPLRSTVSSRASSPPLSG